MKILFYSPVDLRAGLGCERWHCDVTASLKKQFGHEIEIVTGNIGHLRWNDDYLKTQLKDTVYTRLNHWVLFSSLVPTIQTFTILYRKFVWADTIHFIHGFMGQDIIIAILKLFTGKRVLVGHHAPILHTSKIHNLYMNLISRPLLNVFDFHMVLNKKDKVLLDDWKIKNVNFIPSGVRVEKFLNLKRTSHKTLNFLSVGRYDTPQKGFDMAVQAIELINKKYPTNKAMFRFLGSGSTLIDDYAKRNKNIINGGFLKYEDVPQKYLESDVFLLSSREEPFGLILIEAWSSGIPVLATKTEGPLDMLVLNENGWFVPEISKNGIYEGIEKTYLSWVKDNKIFLKMENFCRKTGKMYSIDSTAKKMHEILRYVKEV